MTGVVQCVTAYLGEVIQRPGVARGPVGQSARVQECLRDWPRCHWNRTSVMMRGNQGSDSGWQMDSTGERHGGYLFPTLPSTDTSRGEVGGDKGQRPTIQWTTGLYDASSSWLCLCLAWRALKQGGEPILAASMSKTGPGEELRLHGMRRSPALVVTRGGGPGQGWAGPRARDPLAPWSGWPSWEASMAREAIHHHTFRWEQPFDR